MKYSRVPIVLLIVCSMMLVSCLTFVITKNNFDSSKTFSQSGQPAVITGDLPKNPSPDGKKGPGELKGGKQLKKSPQPSVIPIKTPKLTKRNAAKNDIQQRQSIIQQMLASNKLVFSVMVLLIFMLIVIILWMIKERSTLLSKDHSTLSRKGRKAFGKIIPGNAQDIGSREQQQDAFGFSDLQNTYAMAKNGALALLADGMGGLEMGREASNLAVRTALAEYAIKPIEELIPKALNRIMLAANQAVYEMARQRNLVGSVGTTMLMAAIHQGQLYWASAGDSRIYLYHNAKIVQLTTDHVYARDLAKMVLNNQISQEEADRHPERHALTSYLGLANLPTVDQNLNSLPLQSGDKVMLCSDGLYNVLPVEEIMELLKADAPAAAEALIQRTLAKEFYGQDNVTVAILQYM